MDRDGMESMIKLGPHLVPLARYRTLRAERRREIAGAVAFIVLITVVLFVMLWITP